jgi:cytochrome c551/c552
LRPGRAKFIRGEKYLFEGCPGPNLVLFILNMTAGLESRGRSLPFLVASFALAAGLVHCQDRPAEPASDLALRAPVRPAAPARSGRELYQQHCARCHSLDHSDVGPAMLGIAAKYADRPQELIAYVRYPVPIDPSRFPMPRLELSDQELLAIAGYVFRLPAKAPDILAPPGARPAAKPPEVPPAPAAEGEAVFAKVCANCHDWDNRKIGPPLRPALEKYRGQPEALLAFLKNPGQAEGSHPLMPEVDFSEQEAQAVVNYLLAAPGREKESP